MIISIEHLPKETLDNIISEFVLREGTDYGLREVPHKEKCSDLKTKLLSKEYVITYSEEYQNTSIHRMDKFVRSSNDNLAIMGR